MKKLYVGNLPFSATEEEVREAFSQHGEVMSVALITDRETGRPRGFGFVEMSSGGEEAIQTLHQRDFQGRGLTVSEARPREPRPHLRTARRVVLGQEAGDLLVGHGLDHDLRHAQIR